MYSCYKGLKINRSKLDHPVCIETIKARKQKKKHMKKILKSISINVPATEVLCCSKVMTPAPPACGIMLMVGKAPCISPTCGCPFPEIWTNCPLGLPVSWIGFPPAEVKSQKSEQHTCTCTEFQSVISVRLCKSMVLTPNFVKKKEGRRLLLSY